VKITYNGQEVSKGKDGDGSEAKNPDPKAPEQSPK
jgi:hypothetical protein